MDFKGKVALITGAGNGIGRASAIGFASRGAKVVVVDRDEAAGNATAGILRQQGGDALFVAADVTKSAEVQNYVKLALEAYGSIDCFYNNAGIEGAIAMTSEYDEDMFDRVMAVNVKGVFLGLRHVLPVMIQQKRGAVVNTASVAGLVGSPGMPAYTASKHAVIGLTKTAALEVARTGIRVNAMLPGMVDTPMTRERIYPGQTEILNFAPAGRPAQPEEIAEGVAWMLSDRSSYMMGSSMIIDGGVIAGSPLALDE